MSEKEALRPIVLEISVDNCEGIIGDSLEACSFIVNQGFKVFDANTWEEINIQDVVPARFFRKIMHSSLKELNKYCIEPKEERVLSSFLIDEDKHFNTLPVKQFQLYRKEYL